MYKNFITLLKDIGLGGKHIKIAFSNYNWYDCYSSKNTTHIAVYVNQSEYVQHMDNI